MAVMDRAGDDVCAVDRQPTNCFPAGASSMFGSFRMISVTSDSASNPVAYVRLVFVFSRICSELFGIVLFKWRCHPVAVVTHKIYHPKIVWNLLLKL